VLGWAAVDVVQQRCGNKHQDCEPSTLHLLQPHLQPCHVLELGVAVHPQPGSSSSSSNMVNHESRHQHHVIESACLGAILFRVASAEAQTVSKPQMQHVLPRF
jgi:hypothetical protein